MSDFRPDSLANSDLRNTASNSLYGKSMDALRHTEDFEPAIPASDGHNRLGGPVTEDFSPQSAQPNSAFRTIAENCNPDDRDSISNYMNQLLARVNKGVDRAIKEDSAPAKQPPLPAFNPIVAETRQAAGDSAPVTVEVRLPKRAPEDRDGLLNMRKVANEIASDALKTYDCRRLIRNMYRRAVLTIVALCVSCGLAMITTSAASLAYFGSVVAMLTAATGLWRYNLLTRKLTEAIKTGLLEETASAV